MSAASGNDGDNDNDGQDDGRKKTMNKKQTQGGVGNVAVASRCKDL